MKNRKMSNNEIGSEHPVSNRHLAKKAKKLKDKAPKDNYKCDVFISDTYGFKQFFCTKYNSSEEKLQGNIDLMANKKDRQYFFGKIIKC